MRDNAASFQPHILNPYRLFSNSEDGNNSPATRKDASLLWFAGVAFVVFFARMFSNDTGHVLQLGLYATIVETLIDVIPPVFIASVFFAIARALLRGSTCYLSTRQSLLLTGLLASGYLVVVDCCSWYTLDEIFGCDLRIDRTQVWRIGTAVGAFAAVGLAAIDRYFGEPTSPSDMIAG